jgi:hypothetical protein
MWAGEQFYLWGLFCEQFSIMEIIKPFAEGLSLSLKLRTFPLCYLFVCKYAWFVCCVYAYEFTYIVCVCVCMRALAHLHLHLYM